MNRGMSGGLMKARKGIISVSLDAEQLRELEQMRVSGEAGRSAVVRAALREHFARLRTETSGSGPQDAVVLCLYRHAAYDEVLASIRSLEGDVKSMMHSHAGEGLCLDMAHIEANGVGLRALVQALRGLPAVESVQVVALPAVGNWSGNSSV
jgi:metal-responsive CopG/Arc/MetJ family transcriptional regulator